LNNGDSPGDAEVSQDIFWDSTSPTQAGKPRDGIDNVEIMFSFNAPLAPDFSD